MGPHVATKKFNPDFGKGNRARSGKDVCVSRLLFILRVLARCGKAAWAKIKFK